MSNTFYLLEASYPDGQRISIGLFDSEEKTSEVKREFEQMYSDIRDEIIEKYGPEDESDEETTYELVEYLTSTGKDLILFAKGFVIRQYELNKNMMPDYIENRKASLS